MLPYIGITDFETPQQVREMSDLFDRLSTEHGGPAGHLMVGVMMSYKTLKGLPTKWADVWLPKERLAEVFIDEAGTLNTLHYADYAGLTTSEDILKAVTFGGPHLEAIQLDMPWPSLSLIETLRRYRSDLAIIVQVGSRALEMIGNNPRNFAHRFDPYFDLSVEGVLFDKSMGQGRGMDAEALLPFVHSAQRFGPRLNIAIAGGLGPETMHLAEPILREGTEISLDAQGQLRSSGNSLHPLEWDRASRYLEAAVIALTKRY
ncbi:MAG: hypothetical protein KBD16_02715 [Candidatus Pacebacteria bacterium]|nr:hypothetical protein [Candidatus Paceibacterota bacterium]